VALGSGWQAATAAGTGTEEAAGALVGDGSGTLGACGPVVGGEMLVAIGVGNTAVVTEVADGGTGGTVVEGAAAPDGAEGIPARVVDVVVGTVGAGTEGVVGEIGVTGVVVGLVGVGTEGVLGDSGILDGLWGGGRQRDRVARAG
jgi:hypothetical protein